MGCCKCVDTLWIGFGTPTVSNGATVLWPFFGVTGSPAATSDIPGVDDGRFRALIINHASPVGATDITYTFQVNGVNTALSLVLNSAAAQGFIFADVSVVFGDTFRCTATQASGGNLGVRVFATLLFEAI